MKVKHTWNGLAFVDVHATSGVNVPQKADSAIGVIASFAGVAPGHAHRRATQLPRTNDTFKLPFAEVAVIVDASVARPRAIVNLAIPARVAVNAGASIGPDAAAAVLALAFANRLLAKFAGESGATNADAGLGTRAAV